MTKTLKITNPTAFVTDKGARVGRRPRLTLQYFAPTQAGDWWALNVGHVLEVDGADHIVIGHAGEKGVVYLARVWETGKPLPEKLRQIIARWPEELGAAWRPAPAE